MDYGLFIAGIMVGAAGAIGIVSLAIVVREVAADARQKREARERELDIVGFYHSHPDHPARPSQFDLDHAWPNFAYVIVSVMAGVSKLMTVWYLQEDRSRFDEGTLHGDEDSDSHPAPPVHG